MYLINVSYGQDNNVGHPNSCRNDKTQWFAPLYCRFEKLICCICACVSSNGLLEKMHSHIGCIYLAFPHYVLKNVSSNGLPERMQSHTDNICLTFLHCAFSNVSSKRLHKRMQSHIGCICLTFLHCAFSNVSSNCLHLKISLVLACNRRP